MFDVCLYIYWQVAKCEGNYRKVRGRCAVEVFSLDSAIIYEEDNHKEKLLLPKIWMKEGVLLYDSSVLR